MSGTVDQTLDRIDMVRAYEVVVPAKAGALVSDDISDAGYGGASSFDYMPIVLLEIHTSDGLVGLGEVARGNTLEMVEPWISQLPGFAIRGRSLAHLPIEWRDGAVGVGGLGVEAHPLPIWYSPKLLISAIIGAIETALLDIAGKRMRCRAADVLGGTHRELVPVDYWCARQNPKSLRRIVETACSMGFTGLKMKSRITDPIVEQVRAVRETGGDNFMLTIDPMAQWFGPADALIIMGQLEQFGPKIRIEDPFPQDMPDLWRRMRDATKLPIIFHARSMTILRRAMQDNVADGYNCSGSVADFMAQAAAIEVAGYSCWQGSGLELGVYQASRLHTCAAARACTFASDLQSAVIRQHTLVNWDWPYKNGYLPLPTGHGLGIDLDYDAVKKFLVRQQEYRA